MKKTPLLLASVVPALLLSAVLTLPASAGNKEMVEKSVRELDKLNQEAILEIPDLPKDGTVNYKAVVTEEQGQRKYDFIYKEIIPRQSKTPKTTDQGINFTNSSQKLEEPKTEAPLRGEEEREEKQ